MTECCCSLCNYQSLKVPDIITTDENEEVYYVVVLKSKKINHDCVLFPKRIPESVRYSTNDLPTIQFLKAGNVLKKRFYAICPPIQRKRLWNCSRTCANLGSKPTTLIAAAFSVLFSTLHDFNAIPPFWDFFLPMIPSTNSIISTKTNQVVLDNFVLDFRYHFNFGFDSQKMTELTRFADFNQTYIQFINDMDKTKFYPLIFTPKVTSLFFGENPRHFSPISPLLPNLEQLSVNSLYFPIVFKEMTHCPKLISSWVDEPLDYLMIAKFLRKQRSNLWFKFYSSLNLDLNDTSLLEHFLPVEEEMSDQKGLTIKLVNSNDKFFVLTVDAIWI